jgi:hypothetical protein
MSLFRRFFVGAGYSLLGASVHRVLLAIAAIATARLLGVQEYGVYANLIAVVNLLLMFGLFGVNTAFSSFLPRTTGSDRARQLVVCSGNHDLDFRDAAGEMVPRWMGRVRRSGNSSATAIRALPPAWRRS